MKKHRDRICRLLFGVAALALAHLATAAAGPDSAGPLVKLVGGVEQKAKQLSLKLEACRRAGQDVTVPDASLAVADLFCRYADYDAQHEEMRDAALKAMTYIDGMLDEELHRADEVLAGRAAYPAIPHWRTVGVTWHDGGFWSGSEPVFLSGFNWTAGESEHDPAMLKRLGVNLVDGMVRGDVRADGSFDDRGRSLRQVTHSEFPVDCLLEVKPPQWLLDATPGLAMPGYGNGFSHIIEHPKAIWYRGKFLDHFVPLFGAQRATFAIDLANEPALQGPSDLMFENWRIWLRRKYGDVAGLNRAWSAKLESFAAVNHFPSQPKMMKSGWDRASVDFSRPGVRAMHYDWCAFNNDRVTEYFRSLSDRIHAKAPHVATHVKVMLGNYFLGSTRESGRHLSFSFHTFGLDPEALAEFCDLLGGDVGLGDTSAVEKPNRCLGSVPYAAHWLDAGLSADFLKSLAPEKTFYDSEFHAIDGSRGMGGPAGSAEHVAMALWLAHLHGMSGNLLWYWARGSEGAIMGKSERALGWAKNSLLEQPWKLRAYAQETFALRRFVRPVMAFARQPRPVRLLYSEASAIQDVRYLDALRDAYEALNFLGVSIGLVTERQLAAGRLPADIRLLIVPNAQYVQDETVPALKAACGKGVKVVVIGQESLTATPIGARRENSQVPGAERIGLAEPKDYHPQFNALLKAAGIGRDLLAVDSAGRPAWGIEVRTARDGDRRLAYMVNLMREPVKITLRWQSAGARLRDLRTNTTLADEMTLRPRQVVFGEYSTAKPQAAL